MEPAGYDAMNQKHMQNRLYLESRAKLLKAQEASEGKLQSEIIQARVVTTLTAYHPLAAAAADFVFAVAGE